MRCLSRIEMQEYIDMEINPANKIDMENHIKNCEECSLLFRTAFEDKNMITSLLNNIAPANETNSAPEFKLPAITRKRIVSITVVGIIAAASLIGLVFLLHFGRKPVSGKIPEAEIIMYEYLDGKDLNKLWHDKSQILIIEDKKGNVIQTAITY